MSAARLNSQEPEVTPVCDEKTTQHGRCRDCAQGYLFTDADYGFALYIFADGSPSHWYCLYCGSNHVDILDADGNVVYSEGDLYESGREEL
jgi:hypothetical protein